MVIIIDLKDILHCYLFLNLGNVLELAAIHVDVWIHVTGLSLTHEVTSTLLRMLACLPLPPQLL